MSEIYQKILQAKMAELAAVKEELKNVRDSGKKSWLASKHLKDELAESKSTLESARDRTYLSNAVISNLETQLEETNMSIKSKMEEELKAKEMTHEITEMLNRTRKEMELIRWEKRVEQSERLKLKQIIRMQKQKLRTLQVTLIAAEVEVEAFEASTAEALSHIRYLEPETSSVHHLTQEEYYALIAKARDETALAEWRISLSMKQKLAAEVNQKLALSRLRDVLRKKRKEKEKEIKQDGNSIGDTEEQEFRARVESQFNNGTTTLTARAIPNQKVRKRNRRQRKVKQHIKEASKRKKPSILIQLRSFLVSSFRRFFH